MILISRLFLNSGAWLENIVRMDVVMKKAIQIWLLYCFIQSVFPAYAIAGKTDPSPPQRYTKLNHSGHPLPDSTAAWVMVKDNLTGLIWEAKWNMDGISHYDDPNDADNTYTWYDGNPDTNGGNAGTPGNGMNTEAFINTINLARFGGYSDWRLPSIKELAYLTDMGSKNPSINTKYFPNTVSSWYWSSSTSANYPYHAWGVGFRHGYDSYNYKYIHGYVRAVRGEQQGTETAYGMGSGFKSHFLP